MEENITIEEKANALIGCENIGGCKSQLVNYCQKYYKNGFMCTQKKNRLMDESFDVCKKADIDIYNLAYEILTKIIRIAS